MLPVYTELNNRSRRRMGKVLGRSLTIALTVYLLACVAAYLTFLDGTCSNILLNNFKKGPQVVIAAIAISISVTMTNPLFAFAFRLNFSMLFWNKRQIDQKVTFHAVTFGFVLLATVISVTVTDIATVKFIIIFYHTLHCCKRSTMVETNYNSQ